MRAIARCTHRLRLLFLPAQPSSSAGQTRMTMHAPLEAADAFRTLTSVEAVRSSLSSAAERLGFKYLVCCDLPRPGENLKAMQLANSWPAAWANKYFARNYVLRDPMARELFRTCRPFRWDEVLERRKMERAELAVMREAADFGMRQGLVVPIHGCDARTGVLGMAGEHCNFDARSGAEIHLIAIYAHARLKDLLAGPETTHPAVPLTPRQRECLHWVAAGKSAWAIGEILGVSESTVHATLEKRQAKARRRDAHASRAEGRDERAGPDLTCTCAFTGSLLFPSGLSEGIDGMLSTRSEAIAGPT